LPKKRPAAAVLSNYKATKTGTEKPVDGKRDLLLLLLLPGQRDLLKRLMKALHLMMILKVTVTMSVVNVWEVISKL